MKVPILITWDIDPLTRDKRIRYGIPQKEETSLFKKSLELASDLISEAGYTVHIFVPAFLCKEIEDELKELVKEVQQIGV